MLDNSVRSHIDNQGDWNGEGDINEIMYDNYTN